LTKNPREVKIRSSGVERCIASVQVLLAGAYPPDKQWSWSDELMWQPFPVQTMPTKNDTLLYYDSFCPNADIELNRIRNTDQYKQLFTKNQHLIQYIERSMGEKFNNLRDLFAFYGGIQIEKSNGFDYPHWVNESVLEKMREISTLSSFQIDWSTELIQKLRGGQLLDELITNMKKANDENFEQKLFLYSTHDYNVAIIMNALNVYNSINPPFGASLIFELHKIENSTNVVRLYYLNDTNLESFHQLFIPKCDNDGHCLLEQFINLHLHLIPKDMTEECKIVSNDEDTNNENENKNNTSNANTINFSATKLATLWLFIYFIFI